MGVQRYSTEFEPEADRHTIADSRTGYCMHIALPPRSLGIVNRVAFSSRIGKSLKPVPITNRDIPQYRSELPELPINPALRYTEIGGGLGQLAEYLVKHPQYAGKRPMIIDPANYDAMSKLMDYALDHASKLDLAQETQSRIMDLAVRCDVIRDATRVHLVNTTFAEAYERLRICGRADVVVELYGASLYPDVQGEPSVEVLEASRRNHERYVHLLKRDTKHEPQGVICMMIPSRGSHVTKFGEASLNF